MPSVTQVDCLGMIDGRSPCTPPIPGDYGMEDLSHPHALWTTNMGEEGDEVGKQASA